MNITLTLTDEVIQRLAVLADPSLMSDPDDAGAAALAAITVLVDHAQQGVYRPGAWERAWACEAFGDEWLSRLEPDTRPDMLSGDGRVIFDRPKSSTEEGSGD